MIGDDRDVARVIDLLQTGTSIVLVGPLGSGKSHFLRQVIHRLSATEDEPVVLRSIGPHAAVPHGALTASRDERAARLRDGQPEETERPIVIIDDAQELDPASVAAVVRAVYSGHATALFALTVSREGSTRPVDGNPDAAQMATDLWLRGLAERIDLASLTPRDADLLLDLFAAPELDAMTRASIVALADGSRMLLRELAAEAGHALRHGRDPIDAMRDSPPNGRLSDALAAHGAQLTSVERSTLATLGRVPGISRADAARFLPTAALDSLVNARLVHDDATPAHRLTANAALAHEVERRMGADAVVPLLDGAIRRMFAPSSEWWCPSLAVLAAQSWLQERSLGPDYESVPPAVRHRASLEAARRANDQGEPAQAVAHASLGLRDDDDALLLLEHAFARAAQGGTIDVDALIERLSGVVVDAATLLRCVRVVGLAGPTNVDDLEAAVDRVAALECPDARGSAELAMMRADLLGARMDWTSAVAIAEAVFAQQSNSTSLRVRAAALAGLGHACLGAVNKAQTWFLRAHRTAGERGGITPITTVDRLRIACNEIVAGAVAGTDLGPVLARLGGEVDAAARQGDAESAATAGLVLSCAYAVTADPERAARELDAAVRRARPPAASDLVPLAQIAVAHSLALFDHAEEARQLLDRMDHAAFDGLPTLEHARMVAETYVFTALGQPTEALDAARSAATASETAPALQARDLFQMVALGAGDDALPRMRRMAATSDVPATQRLSAAAEALSALDDPEPDLVAAMRRATTWGDNGTTRGIGIAHDAPAPNGGQRGAASATPDVELTRREREIALLVAEGLGNREIAERLYLSVRTVESHVYQARAKLGAASRVELGRTVAPRRGTSQKTHTVRGL
ncbi:LuxR C-terminal-related transcriptional regulator [Microbacterium sp. AG1240]|uniref:helix-turn-helix transcriptional regulator n=1 Tax=Microbacterium sp. AG1240 TaxID=2183992 RepID=UPI0028774E7A|nr:LuxR C-terminal-related transcriptional regulator [Microbacterium sp. AG1240]